MLSMRSLFGAVASVAHRLISSPRSVAATVLAVYGVWICAVLALQHTPCAFVSPGSHFVQLASQQGVTLPALPSRYAGTASNPSFWGHDGQFTYYIALHPSSARYVVDVPWYRYQRILEPLLIRALAFGSATLVPWLMVAVSWLAVVAGTWAMASWLVSRGRAPGWSLLYGFWPGLAVTVRYDLTDAIAYALVAFALLVLDSPNRSRPHLAAVLTGAALFARQEVAIYAVMMAIGIAAGVLPQRHHGEAGFRRHRFGLAVKFGAVATAPFCIYLVFLSHWLRSAHRPISAPLSAPAPEVISDILLLILPATAALVAFASGGIFSWRSFPAWARSTYSLHLLALTGFMLVGALGVHYSWSYSTVFRYYVPVALGALLCYGSTNALSRPRSTVLLSSFVLSMVSFPILLVTGL
jgi:hypothetical protein